MTEQGAAIAIRQCRFNLQTRFAFSRLIPPELCFVASPSCPRGRRVPAVVLAGVGSLIAVLDHAHGLMTKLSIAVVVCAWVWIVCRSRTRGLKIRSSVLAAMCAATVLTATAALWPVMGPAVVHTLGVAKKPKPPAG
jgi:hypothetical protein